MPRKRGVSKEEGSSDNIGESNSKKQRITREERRAKRSNTLNTNTAKLPEGVPQSSSHPSQFTPRGEVKTNSQKTVNSEVAIIRQNLMLGILSKDASNIQNNLEELKKTNTNINFRDGKDNSTLLHRCAIQGNCTEIIQLLLDNKAKIDAVDNLGRTALHISSTKGDIETVNFLLSKGANSMAKTKINQTPLHEASSAGHIQCVESIINHNALINLPDSEENTALHLAVISSHPKIVEYLIEKQADVLSLNEYGKRPIDIVETETDTKHKKKRYTNSGKMVYKILKKNGGNKTLEPSKNISSSMGHGPGIGFSARKSIDHTSGDTPRARRSYDHRATPVKSKPNLQSLGSTTNVTSEYSRKRGPIKYERKEEITSMEEKERDSPKLQRNVNSDGLDNVKVDRRGFLDGNTVKQDKKHIQKEEQRTMKWISIIQEQQESDIDLIKSKNKKILKLCDYGIPDAVRGQVWLYLAGITERDDEIYYKLLQSEQWTEADEHQVKIDIHRTMPKHILFQEKGLGYVNMVFFFILHYLIKFYF